MIKIVFLFTKENGQVLEPMYRNMKQAPAMNELVKIKEGIWDVWRVCHDLDENYVIVSLREYHT